MKAKTRRLIIILLSVACLSLSLTLILYNIRDQLVFFYTPSELPPATELHGKQVRIGGLVKEGSVQQNQEGSETIFIITDLQGEVGVTYRGIVPSLFREGQGVVVTGSFIDQKFQAKELLAKHDENYMPPEVAKALKKSGKWQGGK